MRTNTTEAEIKDLYVKWAPEYDKDADKYGYVALLKLVEIFDAHMKKAFGEGHLDKTKVLDAASGTGKLGETLKDYGYKNVDALDISPEMLDIARDKNLYKNLICASITDEKIDEIEDGCYDGLTCGAALTVGHIKPSGLNEIVRLVKPGGLVCFTMRIDVHDGKGYGYKEKMDELTEAGVWEIVEKAETPYFAISPITLYQTCYVLVYKRL